MVAPSVDGIKARLTEPPFSAPPRPPPVPSCPPTQKRSWRGVGHDTSELGGDLGSSRGLASPVAAAAHAGAACGEIEAAQHVVPRSPFSVAIALFSYRWTNAEFRAAPHRLPSRSSCSG